MNLEHVAQTERDTLKFRLLAILAIAAVVFATREDVPLIATVGLVIGYLLYSVVLRMYLLPRYTSIYLIYGMLAADLATATGALFIFGVSTPLFLLLPLIIVYYAMYLGYAGSLSAATVSSFGYVGVAFRTEDAAEIGNLVSLQVPLFYIVAILTGYLAQQRFKEREEKQVLQHLIQTEVQARGLVDAIRTLDLTLDAEGVSRDVVSMAPTATGIPYSLMLVVDEDRNQLVSKGANLSPEHTDFQGSKTVTEPSQGSSPGALALAQGRPMFIPGEQLHQLKDLPVWFRETEIPWLVVAPLKVEERGLGVIYLFDFQERDITESELEGVQRFAEIASRSLNNAILYSQAQARSSKLVGELEHTIDRMGRFRDMTGRQVVRLGTLVIDPQRESVGLDGQDLSLPRTEFDLLYILAEKAGAVVNQETLVREVWGQDFVPQGNIVDVTIYRLRRRLAALPTGKRLIRTVRGRGYMLVRPGQP